MEKSGGHPLHQGIKVKSRNRTNQHHTPPNVILWEHVSFGVLLPKYISLWGNFKQAQTEGHGPSFRTVKVMFPILTHPTYECTQPAQLPSRCSRPSVPGTPHSCAHIWLVPLILWGQDLSRPRYAQKWLRTLVHSWSNRMQPKGEEAITCSLDS